MIGLTYQAQLQEQQQEGGTPDPAVTGNPADGPVPDGFGDDDIIADLLGGKDKTERERPARERRERPEREAPRDLDPDDAQQEEEPEDPTPPDEDEETGDEPPDEAAEAGEEPIEGSLDEARAAFEAGDLDRAVEIAFGCKPEEFAPNSKAWTAWRKANDREAERRRGDEQRVAAVHQQNQQWAQGERQKIAHIIEQLRPYEEAHECRVAFKRDGDPEALVRLVEKISEMSWAEFNKVALTKTRRSPAERQMAQRMAELEQRLAQTTQERERQQQQLTEAQVYQNDLTHIRGQLKGDIVKVPKFAERIHAILVKTKGPLGLTKTIEQAAQIVLKNERKRIESHPFVRKPGGKVPPKASEAARTLANRRRPAPPLRRDSQNNGAPNRKDENDDDIIADILGGGGRRRAAGAR